MSNQRTVVVVPQVSERHQRVVQSLRPPSTVSSSSSSSSVSSLSNISLQFEADHVHHRQRPASVVEADKLFDSWPRKAAYAVAELINTEQRFNNDLEDIISGYLRPLTNYFFSFSAVGGARFMETVFSNIAKLQQIHINLLNSFLMSCDDTATLGRVFIDNVDSFTPYIQYCTNYPKCEGVLQNTLKTNIDTRVAIEHCQSILGHALPLITYLLKPVQRIQRYHLLLEAIQKGLDPQHPGFAEIKDAQIAMSRVAEHINQIKKEQEFAQRVKVIQKQLQGLKDDMLQGGDLTSYGNLVAEVKCKVLGRRGGERLLLVFEKLLMCLKRKANATYVYKGHLLMEELDLSEETYSPCVFKVFSVYTSSKFFTIQVENQLVKNELVSKFKSIIVMQMKERERTPEVEVMDTDRDKVEEEQVKSMQFEERDPRTAANGELLGVDGVVMRRSRSALGMPEDRDLTATAKRRRTLIVVASQRSKEAQHTLLRRRSPRQISTKRLSSEGVVLTSYKPIKRDDFAEEDDSAHSDITLSTSTEDSGISLTSSTLLELQLPNQPTRRGVDEIDSNQQLNSILNENNGKIEQHTKLKRRTAIRRKTGSNMRRSASARSQSFDSSYTSKSPAEPCSLATSLPGHLELPTQSRSTSNPMPLIRELALDGCEGEESKEQLGWNKGVGVEEVDFGESVLDRGYWQRSLSVDEGQQPEEISLDFGVRLGNKRVTLNQKPAGTRSDPREIGEEQRHQLLVPADEPPLDKSVVSPANRDDDISTNSSDTDHESTASGDSDSSRGEFIINDQVSPTPNMNGALIMGENEDSYMIVSDSDDDDDDDDEEEEEENEDAGESHEQVTSSLRSHLLVERLNSKENFAGMETLPGLSRHQFGQHSLIKCPPLLSKHRSAVELSSPDPVPGNKSPEPKEWHFPLHQHHCSPLVIHSLTPEPEHSRSHTSQDAPAESILPPTAGFSHQSSLDTSSTSCPPTSPVTDLLTHTNAVPHTSAHTQQASVSLPSSPTHYNQADNNDMTVTDLLRTITPPLGFSSLTSVSSSHSQDTDTSIHMEPTPSDQAVGRENKDVFEETKLADVDDVSCRLGSKSERTSLSNVKTLSSTTTLPINGKAKEHTDKQQKQHNEGSDLRTRLSQTSTEKVDSRAAHLSSLVANTLHRRRNTFPLDQRRERANTLSCVARLLEVCAPNMQQTMAIIMVISLFSLLYYVMNSGWY